jgi:hypothetical protein
MCVDKGIAFCYKHSFRGYYLVKFVRFLQFEFHKFLFLYVGIKSHLSIPRAYSISVYRSQAKKKKQSAFHFTMGKKSKKPYKEEFMILGPV